VVDHRRAHVHDRGDAGLRATHLQQVIDRVFAGAVENPAVFPENLELGPVHLALPYGLEAIVRPRFAILAEMQHHVV
jgi:hypothetical protein